MAKKIAGCMKEAQAHKTRCEGWCLVLTAVSPMVKTALIVIAIMTLAYLGFEPLAIALAPFLGK